eukprot:Awhi_evm1s15113
MTDSENTCSENEKRPSRPRRRLLSQQFSGTPVDSNSDNDDDDYDVDEGLDDTFENDPGVMSAFNSIRRRSRTASASSIGEMKLNSTLTRRRSRKRVKELNKKENHINEVHFYQREIRVLKEKLEYYEVAYK